MAEAYLNHFGNGELIAESAGLTPGETNPFVILAMRQDGIEISSKVGKSVFDLFTLGNRYDTVITVCSPEVGEKCPVFPGRVLRLHWPFTDPATFVGTEEEILVQVHHVREQIKESVLRFISAYKEKGIKLFIC